MRVLFISSSRKGNGISPFINSQANALEKEGVKIDFFLIKGIGIAAYFSAVHQIRKIVRSSAYDLLHAHFGFSGIAARLAAPSEKLVVSFMGDDLEGLVNQKGYYTLKGKILVQIHKIFARWWFDFNIVKSKSLSDLLSSKAPKAIIPNGIDFSAFFPIEKSEACKRLKLNPEINYCLFPSNPDRPVKNYKLFLEAMDLLGSIATPLILKNVDPKDVFLYYNAASVTVLTSFHEGSPNVIKEALACNCCIVATDVGDVVELCGNTEGCFIASYKAEDVASKIASALAFGNKITGRTSISHLNSVIVARHIINLYNNVKSHR